MRLDDYREFHYSNLPVRTKIIEGDIHFLAADICRVLELSNPSMTVKVLDQDEYTLSTAEGRSRNSIPVNFVNESGLYHLIFQSRKPEAKNFRKWVTGTVLPEIRKTGSYQGASQIFGNLSAEENNYLTKQLEIYRDTVTPIFQRFEEEKQQNKSLMDVLAIMHSACH